MKSKIQFGWLITLVCIGCSSLKEVREYAGEASKLAADTTLTVRFRDTYDREQPYLFGEVERREKEDDQRRKAIYGDLLKIHRSVSIYLLTLAKLAGENTFDLDSEIKKLSGGIQAYPDLGINKQHVDAVANMTTLLTKWIMYSHQKHAVRDMIKESNAAVQILLEGMLSLVRLYQKTNTNEEKTVLGFFEATIPFTESPKDQLLNTLARAHQQSKTFEYIKARSKYSEAEKGIKKVAEGHQKLYDQLAKLSGDEIKALLQTATKDIKDIRENLDNVR